jgi:signal transduction histidine kinase
MRLCVRTNLKIMIGGFAASAVVLPVVVAFLTWVAASSNIDEAPQLRLHLVEVEVSRAVTRDREGRMSARAGYQPPPGFSLVLADPEGRVVYSSAPALPPGAAADLASVAAALGPLRGSMSFFAENVEAKGEILGSYFAWMPRTMLVLPPSPVKSVRLSLMILFLVVVVFLLGGLVATKLAHAVFKLEDAARRIAAGDLGTAVTVDEDIREIKDLAAAMDRMRVALRENMDRRARFLSAISHDLRTPLTSIGGYLEAVSDGLAGDPKTLEHYVGIMRGKTRLLEGRIAGLIEFARIETDEWRMGFEPVELESFLDTLCREFREDTALLGRRFDFDLAALSGLRVPADKVLLTRAVENLLSNALRYSPPGSSVGMKAERAAGPGGGVEYLVHIDDEGPGVAPAERERVFEPFVRGSGAREGEGSGLGLYIVASVIKGHGWDIRVGEAAGGGGRFTVSIPGSLVSRA